MSAALPFLIPGSVALEPPKLASLSVSFQNDEEVVRRRPYMSAHMVRPGAFSCDELKALACDAYETCPVIAFSDIDVRRPDRPKLEQNGIDEASLRARCAAALAKSGVVGGGIKHYKQAISERFDYLGSVGASFHNDTDGDWPRCLFWILVLDATDCDLVFPLTGVRMGLEAGDLIVFDPCLPHGLCRPRDAGRVVESSFFKNPRQAFISGEMLLSDKQWANLGCPWVAESDVEVSELIDLATCDFDSVTGAIEPRGAAAGARVPR